MWSLLLKNSRERKNTPKNNLLPKKIIQRKRDLKVKTMILSREKFKKILMRILHPKRTILLKMKLSLRRTPF